MSQALVRVVSAVVVAVADIRFVDAASVVASEVVCCALHRAACCWLVGEILTVRST